MTPAQPCQQQPEEEKPQTQELFWGRKRALTLPQHTAPALQHRAEPKWLPRGWRASLWAEQCCREGEAGAGTCYLGFSLAQGLGRSDPRDCRIPALVPAPRHHQAPAQGDLAAPAAPAADSRA